MSLYRLNASIRTDGSNSRQLAGLVGQQWRSTHPTDPVVIRDIGTEPIPATAWPDAAFAKFVPEDSRTAGQQQAVALATTLASELIAADALLFASPPPSLANPRSWSLSAAAPTAPAARAKAGTTRPDGCGA